MLIIGTSKQKIFQGFFTIFFVGRSTNNLVNIVLLIEFYAIKIRLIKRRLQNYIPQNGVKFFGKILMAGI